MIDFAASDAAMTDDEISAVKNGVVMLPMTAGSVVLIYNLPGGPSNRLIFGLPYPPAVYNSPRGPLRLKPPLQFGLLDSNLAPNADRI